MKGAATDEVDDKFIDALNEETIATCVAHVDGGARDLFHDCVVQEQYRTVAELSFISLLMRPTKKSISLGTG